jgi:hypothetical protein
MKTFTQYLNHHMKERHRIMLRRLSIADMSEASHQYTTIAFVKASWHCSKRQFMANTFLPVIHCDKVAKHLYDCWQEDRKYITPFPE